MGDPIHSSNGTCPQCGSKDIKEDAFDPHNLRYWGVAILLLSRVFHNPFMTFLFWAFIAFLIAFLVRSIFSRTKMKCMSCGAAFEKQKQ